MGVGGVKPVCNAPHWILNSKVQPLALTTNRCTGTHWSGGFSTSAALFRLAVDSKFTSLGRMPCELNCNAAHTNSSPIRTSHNAQSRANSILFD
ncbi:hypothetical protein Mal48_46560 [Thalassoglobus polymorphus]|uniref:Uncharacterized protein n=1 Tax=Thalassoglobus polymorphus TaxID=2527994 RepID=A0A517QUR7_9PLAN|nr:hypothetical protein Mal48_46560 [Thalassoglobus polymorphus]